MSTYRISSFQTKFNVTYYDIYNHEDNDRRTVFTNSLLIQQVLFCAYKTEANINLELEDDNNIKRVFPFEAYMNTNHNYPYGGNHCIARIATQRAINGSDHLEVFIKDRKDYQTDPSKQTAYNIFEQHLQQILLFAFLSAERNAYMYPRSFSYNIDIQFQNNDIRIVSMR